MRFIGINYNDNAHEKQAMKDLAASLGIGFHESNAILMPVCCASYNTKLNLVGNFLQMPLKEIEKRKNASAFCRSCKEMGAHVYVLYLRNWKDRMKSRMAHLYCGIRRHSV